MTPVRAVYDCVVFLQGAGRSTGPARKWLELIDQGIVTLCLSPPVLAEVEEVLSRPVLLHRFPLRRSDDSLER